MGFRGLWVSGFGARYRGAGCRADGVWGERVEG